MNLTFARLIVGLLALSLTCLAQSSGDATAKKGANKSTDKAAASSAKTGGHTAAEQNIEKMEKNLWEGWKNNDTKPFQELVTQDAVNVVGKTIDYGKDTMIKNLMAMDCKVNSYSLSDFRYTWIDSDAVIVTYVANQDATCGGNKVPAKVNASSVWSKRGGKWLSPFHQETPAM